MITEQQASFIAQSAFQIHRETRAVFQRPDVDWNVLVTPLKGYGDKFRVVLETVEGGKNTVAATCCIDPALGSFFIETTGIFMVDAPL